MTTLFYIKFGVWTHFFKRYSFMPFKTKSEP
jgi:hypothetical protein